MLKKVVSLALALMLAISVVGAFPVMAERIDTDIPYAVEGGNIYFDPDTGTITGYDGNITDLTIPEEIKGVAVTSIDDYAFEDCASLQHINLPDGITKIGEGAFEDTALTEVTIPGNVEIIEEHAFDGCDFLDTITICYGVTRIKDYAFATKGRPWHNITSVTIPQSVVFIGFCAFSSIFESGTQKIENVYYGGNETQWNGIAIDERNENLTEASNIVFSDVPDSGKCGESITWEIDGEKLLIDGTGDMDDYPTLYPIWCLYKYTSVRISEGVTSIGEYAFYKKFSSTSGLLVSGDLMKSIVIPKSVKQIKDNAFDGCDLLNDIYYGGSENDWETIEIGDYGNDILSNPRVNIHYDYKAEDGDDPDTPVAYEVGGGNIYFDPATGTITGSDKNITSAEIPEEVGGVAVTSIRDGAFYDCEDLVSVSMPSVTRIGARAFNLCAILESVEMPKVTHVGDNAFRSCNERLTSVSMPSVEVIGNSAFSLCYALKSVYLPKSLERVEHGAFLGDDLSDIYYEGTEADRANISIGNSNDTLLKAKWQYEYNFEREDDPSTPVAYPVEGGNIYFDPATGTVTGYDGEIVNLEIPEEISGVAVTRIGEKAFSNCETLKSMALPSVLDIGNSAFYWCSLLEHVEMPKVKTVGELAFAGHTSLEYMNMPSVTTVGSGAFSMSSIQQVSMPSVVTLEELAFNGCNLLERVEMPNIVTIGDDAFNTCYSLRILTIPISLKAVGNNAFVYCDGLETVYYEGSEEDWSSVDVGEGNEALLNAIWYEGNPYEGCEQTEDGFLYKIGDDGYAHILKYVGTNRKIVIPTEIEEHDARLFSEAFANCQALVEVSIPKAEIIDGAMHLFRDCANLKKVSLPADMEFIPSIMFGGCVSLEDVVLPDGVIDIGDGAFSGCTSLKHINIPYGVDGILFSGFSGSGLVEVDLPDTITALGAAVFYGCENLERVNLGKGIKILNGSTFEGCKKLKEITLPHSIESIGSDAFTDCPLLTDIYYEGTEEEWNTILANSIIDERDIMDEGVIVHFLAGEPSEKKTQNILVSEMSEKTYGDAGFKLEVTPDETAQLTNFTYESDNESVAAIDGEGCITIKGAGEANITVREAGNDEYAAFEYVQKLVVNKAKITVKADNKSKKTGSEDPELTYTYEGTLFGDDAFTGALEREAGETVGVYDILQGTLKINDNYDITFVKGKFEIADKTIQNITVSEIGEKVYGGAGFKLEVTPDETAQLTNFTYESDNKSVAAVDGDGNITIKGAGEANITVREAGNDEYAAFEYVQKLVVNKAKITVKADNKSKKTGSEDPELTYTYEGTLFGDDAFTGALERGAGETAGVYDILQGTLKINDNYDITFVKGRFEIADKTIQNITVSEIGEKTYGGAGFKLEVTPDETAQLTNFTYESDNKSVAAVDGDGNITIKGAGEANITVREAGNDEYAAFEYVQKLVVNKKKITISALDLGGRTAEFEGIIEGDEVGLDFEKITLSDVNIKEDGTASAKAKNFVLTGSGAANYELETGEFICEVNGESIATVTLTAAENGEVAGSGSYLKGSEITLTATPNNGYKFSGWYVGNKRVSASASYTFKIEENIELTAKFTRKSSGGGGGGSVYYSVKFDTDGGSAVKSQSVKEGVSAQAPSVPTKEGFNFAGWYADKELTKAYDFTGKVTANITLYAKWTNIETKPEGGNAIVLIIGSKEAKVFGQTKTNDVAPIIRNDRTMLPARFVAESLGATVSWNNDERSVVIVKGETRIVIVIGAENATVNGKIVPLDSPAFIENDRTYTPLRFIAENLGAKVEWNDETKTVTITK